MIFLIRNTDFSRSVFCALKGPIVNPVYNENVGCVLETDQFPAISYRECTCLVPLSLKHFLIRELSLIPSANLK